MGVVSGDVTLVSSGAASAKRPSRRRAPCARRACPSMRSMRRRRAGRRARRRRGGPRCSRSRPRAAACSRRRPRPRPCWRRSRDARRFASRAPARPRCSGAISAVSFSPRHSGAARLSAGRAMRRLAILVLALAPARRLFALGAAQDSPAAVRRRLAGASGRRPRRRPAGRGRRSPPPGAGTRRRAAFGPGEAYNRGVALTRAGRYAEALAAFDEALGRDAEDADAAANREIVAAVSRPPAARGAGARAGPPAPTPRSRSTGRARRRS